MLALLGLSLIAVGCQQPQTVCEYDPLMEAPPVSQNASQAATPAFDSQRIRKMAISPASCSTENSQDIASLGKALTSEIAGIGRLEAIQLPSDSSSKKNVVKTGKFDERELIAIHRKFSADAVLYTHIEESFPYWPMRMSVSMAIVDTHDAIGIADVRGRWDLSNPQTAKEFADFVRFRYTNVNETSLDPLLQSPMVFRAFVAREIAEKIDAVMR